MDANALNLQEQQQQQQQQQQSPPLSTEDFITELFCRVDTALAGVPRHPLARLWPSEVVTLDILYALKGRGERAFYRWADRDLRPLFPHLPERTRLFRLFACHRDWANRFLAEPTTLFGVIDSFGVEMVNTLRLGRSRRQIGRRGYCARRWIGGVKLGLVLDAHGQVCAWDADVAGAYDADAFGHLIARFADRMIVLADGNFHKSPFHRPDYANDPDPPNLKLCPRGSWDERKLVETVLSMISGGTGSGVCALKKVTERCWANLMSHLGAALAAFNLLVGWDPGEPRLAVARFSL
jgi:hypothetical protein